MKVVLIRPVRKLGKIGDAVEVKPGFGRNFLVPQGFAVRATESNMQMIASQKHELEAKNSEAHEVAATLATKIEGKDFTFIRQSAADGRLFGSVANKEISKVLVDAGYEVSHSQVELEKPIKTLGVYNVLLVLHTDVAASVIVNVARSESEAIDALREFKNPKEAEVEEEFTVELPKSKEQEIEPEEDLGEAA